MKPKLIIFLATTALVLTTAVLGFIWALNPSQTDQPNLNQTPTENPQTEDQPVKGWQVISKVTPIIEKIITSLTPEKTKPPLAILKDVGEPYLDYLGLTEDDFKNMAEADFDIIQSNFDICATQEDVLYFLNQSQRHGLKVILPAGSGEAEWGYVCDQDYSQTQAPVWQKEAVTNWVKKYKTHPAVFGWDISNEAGGNFPHADKSDIRLSLSQLQAAYRDVKAADPSHPIMIRMNGWVFYEKEPDDYFDSENPFGGGAADLVMVNAYSNVDEYFTDFVTKVTSEATSAILSLNPEAKVIVALGAWEEPPLWVEPKTENLENEYQYLLKLKNLEGIAFFKYGAKGSEWYLPQDSPALWQKIQELLPHTR